MKYTVLLLLITAAAVRAQNNYAVRNLVSDIPGVAEQTDANLKNPWGLAASSTSPFWISNNHSGNTTVYSADGQSFPDGNPLVAPFAPAGGRAGDFGAHGPGVQRYRWL